MMMIVSSTTALLGLLGLFGTADAELPPPGPPSDFAAWDDKTYAFTSTRPSSGSHQAWLPQSNGYMGLAQGSLGPFFEANRHDDSAGPRHTFATVAGFWTEGEQGGERFLAGIPHFTDLLVEACGNVLNGSVDTAEISDFNSTLSFLDGFATWTYRWTPPGCPGDTVLDISYESLLPRDNSQLAAVRLSLGSSSDVEVRITDVVDGRSADRTSNFQTRFFPGPKRGILASVSPAGRDEAAAVYIYSTVSSPDFPSFASAMSSDPDTSSVSQTYKMQLGPGAQRLTTTVDKYVGVASTDHFEAAPSVAMQAAMQASKAGWDALRSSQGGPYGASNHGGSESAPGHDEL